MQGRVIKNISNDYTVDVNGNEYICKPRGKFRIEGKTPLVGDFVTFDEISHTIMSILPRTNCLVRPSIANIDQAMIIVSTKEPDLDLYLLDQLLVIIEYNSIKPLICFTKIDKLSEIEKTKIIIVEDYYRSLGYPVFENNQIEDIGMCFFDKITVFIGQSGAGKSTLLNHLDKTLNLKTDEISFALGRGKHTTRHVELLPILGGWIADTPGFSNIDFGDMSSGDIRDQFVEFNQYREFCKYKDCMHVKEDHCCIKEFVKTGKIKKSRYDNYIKFITKG